MPFCNCVECQWVRADHVGGFKQVKGWTVHDIGEKAEHLYELDNS